MPDALYYSVTGFIVVFAHCWHFVPLLNVNALSVSVRQLAECDYSNASGNISSRQPLWLLSAYS
jgi:hypothetical protein